MLSLIIFLPLVGGIFILFTSKANEALMKGVALGASLGSTILLLFVTVLYKIGGGMQFVEQHSWISTLGITYHVGVDGLSLPLVALTALLSVLSIVYSWRIEVRLKEYLFLFLLLETGMLGVFAALDFFLFYIFWEITLVPMYFIIAIWGGPRREYAAIKFFLYTLIGSLAMLLAILLMYFNADPHTFNMLALTQQQPLAGKPVLAALAFWGFFLSFAIKVPMWPFHTWLPDAHVEAPTAGSVILAGVLLKMGTYGFVRVSLPMRSPNASVRPARSPCQKGIFPGTPAAGVTSTRSRVICSARHEDAPRRNTSPSRSSKTISSSSSPTRRLVLFFREAPSSPSRPSPSWRNTP